jgi:hypothetical protein
VPVLARALDTLPEAARQELVRELALRYDQPSSDWRAWNWGRARAYRLLSSLEAE